MPLLILFDPPFERFLAVEKIGTRQFQFLLQQVLSTQQIAFQRLFAAPLGVAVLVEPPFLKNLRAFTGPGGLALIQDLTPDELLLFALFPDGD